MPAVVVPAGLRMCALSKVMYAVIMFTVGMFAMVGIFQGAV